MQEIILASTSERRFKLLEDMGITYKAVAPKRRNMFLMTQLKRFL